MNLRRNGRQLSGQYSYKKIGKSIDIKGTINEQESFVIDEFDNTGKSTGIFKGRFVSADRLEGTWSKPNGETPMPFSLTVSEGGTDTSVGDADVLAEGGGYDGLDAEAHSEARKYWVARIAKCGDSFYTKDNIFTHEFKDFGFDIQPSSLSRADTMNGIEWKGGTSANVAMTRTYSPQPTLHYNPGWSKWSNGLTEGIGRLYANVVKEKGHWNVVPGFAAGGGLKFIKCSDIPK
ncbi:MAG TPA: hypothetical protein VJT15_04835 [Pyrinomonadaceae bacterium]|nr:hypothetical protein [Pyrinomonadaceae bacterium]